MAHRKNKRRSTIGTIEKRGENSYRIKVTLDGELFTETVHGSFQDADERLLDIQLGRAAANRSITWERYWRVYVEPTFDNLKPKTVHEYRRLWAVDIEPAIGSRRVAETDWRAVQKLVDSMKATPSKQHHAFALMRKICNYAVRDGILQRNPCDRSIRLVPVVKKKKVEPTPQLVVDTIEAAMSTKYAPVVLCMLGCGLRVEEACALDWLDVDDVTVDGKRYAALSVHRTAVSINGALIMQESTKTASSVRTVLLGEPFAPLLLGLRSDGALVPSINGRTSPSTIAHNWRLWCQRHGVPYVPLGQMRSVYATLACECVDSSLVSLVLGHTDGTTRGRNYQQATLHGMAIVADAYGALFLGQSWDNNYLNWDKMPLISR